MQTFNAMRSSRSSGGPRPSPPIPYTIIRSNSDYTHRPVRALGNGTWGYMEGATTPDFESGFSFAIATYSSALLTMLQERCMVAARGKRVWNKRTCKFKISY